MTPSIEPIPGEPAAIVDTGGDTDTDASGERALVVTDYHAGLEAGLHREGVSVPSRETERREHLRRLLGESDADRVIFLGDLAHAIGDPRGPEREELARLLEAVTEHVPVTVVKGNHDGGIETVPERAGIDRVSVTPTNGVRVGSVGFAHGHTWPAPEVVRAPLVCIGHEHPTVRLTDSVGGRRAERVWLRGDLDPAPFETHEHGRDRTGDTDELSEPGGEALGTSRAGETVGTAELVVFPAFNDLVGGTWVNVPEQGFLAPFLPDGLADGEAYLLDGTRLGAYDRV